MQFDYIVAVDACDGIGVAGGPLPWSGTPEGNDDMKWFQEVTCKHRVKGGAAHGGAAHGGPVNVVIMGRATWDSIPEKYRPLPRRVNIVVTSTPCSAPLSFTSFTAAVSHCVESYHTDSQVTVIGGRGMYEAALLHPRLRYGYVTRFAASYGCDVDIMRLLPLISAPCRVATVREHNIYLRYDYRHKCEPLYLDLLTELLSAPLRTNRTGVDVHGLFHRVLKFDLHDSRGPVLPLVTTKRVSFKSVYHELIWFLRGSTDTSYLRRHGVTIWDGNSTREYLDSRGLTDYPVGHLGPVYGHQWRNWGAPAGGVGVDQIEGVIETLRSDPMSRRLLVSAWNVADLDKMALPPCHYSFQFHVEMPTGSGEECGKPVLNCLVNLRSADVALGVPFNIASYSLLTHIIAEIVGMTPGVLSVSMADCHLYQNHDDGARLIASRTPYRFPTLHFSDKITSTKNKTLADFTTKFTASDYLLEYEHHEGVKMTMAV